jgi:hypothetical protein
MAHLSQTINSIQRSILPMPTDNPAEPSSPLEEVMDDIRQELVQRVAAADREENREIYDALEDE